MKTDGSLSSSPGVAARATGSAPAERAPVAAEGQANGAGYPLLGPGVLLFVLTTFVYLRVASFGFTNCDDGAYVYENPHVRGGLTEEGLIWALTSLHGGVSYWHPLTWLSHQLDCELFGLRPGPQHLTSVWWHGLNVILVLKLVRELRMGRNEALLVAGLFALHPLHVESVAWIAERKDVLYAAFWLLALRFYVRWRFEQRRTHYALAGVAFLASLACKPTAMTLPGVLFLTDFLLDPRHQSLWQRVRRISPFALLGTISLGLTFVGQWKLGAVQSFDQLSVGARLGRALVAYVVYIRQFLVPWDLGFGYVAVRPYSGPAVFGAFASLAGIGAWCWSHWTKRPRLLFGWLWFLVTLVPNIGLLQVGAQARADRYMYIPMIGLGIVLANLGNSKVLGARSWRHTGIAVMLLACAILSFRQLRHWRDGISLFSRAVALNPDNWFAQQGLAGALMRSGAFDAAIPHLERSLLLPGNSAEAHRKLGLCFCRKGALERALAEYEVALRLESDSLEAQSGRDLARAGLLRQVRSSKEASVRETSDPGP